MPDYEAFICRCKEEGEKAADELHAEVLSRLSGGTALLLTRGIAPEDFMTAIISSLEWDYQAHVTGIYYDQWGAVHAEDESGWRVLVQFDRLEDGLAAVWKAYADRKAEGDGSEHPPA